MKHRLQQQENPSWKQSSSRVAFCLPHNNQEICGVTFPTKGNEIGGHAFINK